MKIHYLKPEGSFGSQVAHALNKRCFEGAAGMALCDTNIGVLTSFAHSAASYEDLGVVPVRNSNAGIVADVIKFWLNNNRQLYVIGEVDLRVHHHLLARQGVALQDIKLILSHEQGLAQCSERLSRWGFLRDKRHPVESTSLAAQLVSSTPEFARAGAISSKQCAREFGLVVLAENIEDAQDNTTRFHIVANCTGALPAWRYGTDAYKMSLIFTVKNNIGALYKVLGRIYEAHLNMEFIASIQFGGMNDVAFYVEMDAPKIEERETMLRYIAEATETFICLGIYPRGTTIEE